MLYNYYLSKISIVINLKLTIIIRKNVNIIRKLNLIYTPNNISSFSEYEIKLIKLFENLVLTIRVILLYGLLLLKSYIYWIIVIYSILG